MASLDWKVPRHDNIVCQPSEIALCNNGFLITTRPFLLLLSFLASLEVSCGNTCVRAELEHPMRLGGRYILPLTVERSEAEKKTSL